MNPNPYPPQEAWQDIAKAQKQALKLRHRGLSYVFWWWGGLWSLAFALLAAYGNHPWLQAVWAGLWGLGVTGTWFFYRHYGWRVRPRGGEMHPGLYWTLMTAFMAAILALLPPPDLYTLGAALFVMIMWMYLIQGLHTRHPCLPHLSVGASMATLLGHFLFPSELFAWWMTLVTSLSLLAGGWCRHRKQP